MTLLQRLEGDGAFPFGRPNGPRDVTWRGSGNPRLLVVGVYPSALHVRWVAPHGVATPAEGVGRVTAMAVDVEPEVFWRGDSADALVETWKNQVDFIEGDEPGCDGHASAHGNGPSGRTVDTYLDALAITPTDTAYLDVYPVFVVHQGPGSQGRAVRRDYDPIVAHLGSGGRSIATLPRRPSATELPRMAAERFGGWLRDTIASLQPELVVTLGAESWDSLALVPGLALNHEAESLAATKGAYGTAGELTIARKTMPWIPLVHPGLLGKNAEWTARHHHWAESQR